MARTSPQIFNVRVPYPSSATNSLEIVIGAPGQVKVGGGATEGFVTGTVEYDRQLWAPKVEERAGTVRIVQAERFEDRFDFSLDTVNRWNLQLGSERPFDMLVRCGVNQGRWDLGGIPLTDLRIETGVSENTFTFDAVNPQVMKRLDLRCGVASVELDGLLNANFERMDVKGGVGSVTLRFTGESLKRNTRLKIEGGVGQFSVVVAKGVPARADVTGLAGVNNRGDFKQLKAGSLFGGSYETPDYATATGPRLTVDITAGISGISLETH